MLKLKNIRKSYKTADFVQVALNDVSIAFRDNEFAAILGPSGSGKTTMLNIVGGLDQYESGDLEIEGTSTKEFKDQDWDTYRNNRIGFVFQSYNLIPHQTVLANVELALTLSGVSVSERRARAKEALAEVGLRDHVHKKPSQLSGGQMQRVAIARALINDPEILLADEPTGALDTTTSTQVMDLLTQIAKDRLVIMVTHNSELAEEYATRIVHLKDGNIVSDTQPFDPNEDEAHSGREIRKSSMSFMTAISLSFSNLMTKKWRTLVTALAGSIGIIGIAAILALANGINAYIRSVEEDTLSLYPLMIQSVGFDLGAMFEPPEGGGPGGGSGEDERAYLVRERRVLENMFALTSVNDLGSLKEYFEDNRETIDPLVNTIHYMYDITPQIFLADTSDGVQQVNPDPFFAPFMPGNDMGAMMGFGFGMNVFHEMPSDIEMFEQQYDVLAGHWPNNYDEAILILSHGGRLTDLELYTMGLRDRAILENMMESLMNNTEFTLGSDEELEYFSHETLMSVEFKVVNPFAMYQYDDTFNVWVDHSGDDDFMEPLIEESTYLRIVGIARPSPTATATALTNGINYTPELIHHMMQEAANAPIVMEQIAYPEINIFTGRTFVEEAEDRVGLFDFAQLISINEEALQEAFAVDMSALNFAGLNLDPGAFNFDPGGFDFDPGTFQLNPGDFDLGDLNFSMDGVTLPPFEMGDIMGDMLGTLAGQVNVPPQALMGIVVNVMQGFFAEITQSGITNPAEILAALQAYLARPDVQESINTQLLQIIVDSELQEQLADLLGAAIQEAVGAYMEQIMGALQIQIMRQVQQLIEIAMTSMAGQLASQIETQIERMLGAGQMENMMGELMTQITTQIEGAMGDLAGLMEGIDPEAIAAAFQIEMGEEEIFQLMTAMMNPVENSYERNLSLLGFADPDIPSQINIYPRNFDSKQEILDILDRYNERMEAEDPDRMVQFTDLIGAMMSGVTDIINMVSYALIAFVSISLVVSSIMIGVITYISVLERKKEIGILRAIGASKSNIRRVFNAETLIIGFVAGVLGVLITLVIAEIANVIVLNRFDIERIARLPASAAVVLIGASMLLTIIAGLFPSSAAARKDPIEALRSE